ncbi:MAG TPA: glycine rich domain-containing protein, partial [Bacilli bacterium]|nr:glycine rich domain-containing protein [Bacilli bacterium]
PVNGKYKIELWGASGGGTSAMSGRGGYTVGEFDLQLEQQLNIYVGGQGTTAELGLSAPGGYNGGGATGFSKQYLSSSGGGATDIRIDGSELVNRILVAGGGGGGGSKNDSVATCNGGAGGGTAGTIGTCSAPSYIGGAGTQSAGGAGGTYTTNTSINATAGTLGIGGTGSTYETSTSKSAGGGGGGGYYGGGGGSRYGGGGGGSGYCSGSNCTTSSGTESFSNTASTGYEVGHKGNGYARITLIALN